MGYTPDMETTSLRVGGISCGHCVRSVKNTLEALPGVTTVCVDLESGRAEIEHDGTVDDKALVAALLDDGYQASTIQ